MRAIEEKKRKPKISLDQVNGLIDGVMNRARSLKGGKGGSLEPGDGGSLTVWVESAGGKEEPRKEEIPCYEKWT